MQLYILQESNKVSKPDHQQQIQKDFHEASAKLHLQQQRCDQ